MEEILINKLKNFVRKVELYLSLYKCPKCGNENVEHNDVYCSKCGGKFEWGSDDADKPEEDYF